MRKIALMPTVALLILFLMMIISPVEAVTKEPYWEHSEFNPADFDQPGKQWISEEGILHTKDWHWVGSYEGTLGTGTMDIWFEQISLDLATGEGTLSGRWLITITPQNTMSGYGRGTITGSNCDQPSPTKSPLSSCQVKRYLFKPYVHCPCA